jgi:hypothetical protein
MSRHPPDFYPRIDPALLELHSVVCYLFGIDLPHMSLVNNIRTSIMGLLMQEKEPTDSSMLDQAEGIRQAMISVLGEDARFEHPHLLRRVRYAEDIKALWFLRSDLMAVLSQLYGEHRAQDVMQHLNEMFKGYLTDAKGIGNTKFSSRP